MSGGWFIVWKYARNGNAGIVQSDTAATANALVERDSDGSDLPDHRPRFDRRTLRRPRLRGRARPRRPPGQLHGRRDVGQERHLLPLRRHRRRGHVTLPAASGFSGKTVKFKKTDTSVNAVIADGNSTETIDGALVTRCTANTSRELKCDGTGWHVESPRVAG
jgi:hypothetical protein